MCVFVVCLFVFKIWALKGKRGGIQPEKAEWDHCHAAESFLWRGTEGGVEGQTDGEAAEKSEADRRKRRASPHQMRNRGVCGECEITERTERRNKGGGVIRG